MKTWKIAGITGLLLASLLICGSAQARRFDNHPSYNRYQNQGNHYNDGYQHQPRWEGAPGREFRHDRGRHHGWERGNHYGWDRHNRMAARNSRWW
jgi:hypothetical protein